jgi:hypothetical protein
MHRLLVPDELTQEALFTYRNWTARRCYPHPERPTSPLWWVVDGEPEQYVLVEGERRKAHLAQLPPTRLFDLADETTLSLPVPVTGGSWLHESTPADDRSGPTLETGSLDIEWPAEVQEPVPAGAVLVAGDLAPGGNSPTAVAEQVGLPQAAPSMRVEDRFRRSLDAILVELTTPVEVDPERPARVPVRIVAPIHEEGADRPMVLPSHAELVSEEFLNCPELSRPALAPIEARTPPSPRLRVPARAFAVLAGVLVLFLGFAFWLFH